MSEEKLDLILEIVKENKADISTVKEQQHKLSTSVQLIAQEMKSHKGETKESFERVHKRIDKEQEMLKETRDDLKTIEPKVTELSNILLWAKRTVVTALIGGIMYATSQFLIK